MVDGRVVGLSVINGALSAFGAFMNILVFVVIFTNDELQKGLNLLIVSLAVSDLISCLLSQPMYVYYLNANEPSGTFMLVFQIITFISLHASFSNLIGITFYRMRALTRPFTHLLAVSKSEVLSVIGILWAISIVIGVLFSIEPTKAASPYFHVVMILALIVTYVRIYWVATQKKKKIATQEGLANYNVQAATLRHENSAAQTSAILVGSSLVCFLPDVIFDLLGMADQSRLSWGYTLLFASSCFNPCVYIWRSDQFRTALGRTLRTIQQHIC